MDQTLVFGLAAVLVIGALLFAFVSKMTNKKCKKHFNVEQYQARCLANEQRLKSDNPASFHLSVL